MKLKMILLLVTVLITQSAFADRVFLIQHGAASQLLVMLALGVIYGVGLSLLGVRFGILIGMVAGLASIVPYLGFVVGISMVWLRDWPVLFPISALW